MPRTKAATSLAGLVESDSEPDFDAFDAQDSQSSRHAARPAEITKKPRGRPPANKVVKPGPKQGWRAGSAATQGAAPRQALKERNINPPRSSRQAGKSTAGVNRKPVGRPPQRKRSIGNGPGDSIIDSETTIDAPASKRPRQDTVEEEAMDADPVNTMDVGDDLVDTQLPGERPASPEAAESDKIGGLLAFNADDVSLRRRLGELSKRYENLESRHKELREVGIKEAERNMERTRMQAEDNKKVAGKLIAELKAELAAKSSVEEESERLRHQLEMGEEKCNRLQLKVTELMAGLAEARAEVKTLNTKLSAARTEIGTSAPGSALKTTGSTARGAQSEYLHTVLAKEDLYGDLTGLIVRGVKNGDSETEFDCIQTGRNGTLHFKLALDRTDSSDQYDDVQYAYRPQLHNDRDSDLLDVLPDFLQEDITFPRTHASKFYSRVVKSLTDRIE